MSDTKLVVIGRAEKVLLPDLFGKEYVFAKVDTGADVSSLWASNIEVTDEGLRFTAFGKGSPLFTGEPIVVPEGDYTVTRVASSFGHKETRYVIKTPIKLGGRRVLASFTLSDRSNKTYPVLLGRRLLHGKFVVNVAEGKPLREIEKAKKAQMKIELSKKDS